MADLNNSLVTGLTAKQIVSKRDGSGNARDRMTALELAALTFTQEAERQHITNIKADGNAEIMGACETVVAEVLPLVHKFREPPKAIEAAEVPALPPAPSLEAPWLKHLRKAGG